MSLRTITLTISLFCIAALAYGETKPLRVFVLIGQSNMQGHANVSTLGHLESSSKTKSMLGDIIDGDGNPIVHDDIWISYLTASGVKQGKLTTGYGANEQKIGSELTFGITMQKRIGEPILIIKMAWGGKSIHTDFRPPSAGDFEFTPKVLKRLKRRGRDIEKLQAEKKAATGIFYQQSVQHAKRVLQDIKSVYPAYDQGGGYELAGIVWFQGWNDMVDSGVYPNRTEPGGFDQYSELLGQFIKNIRSDLNAPKAPFVIGVMGVGGPTELHELEREKKIHQNFRDAMAKPASLPEFDGNVFTVKTEEFWDLELAALVKREDQIRNEVGQAKKDGRMAELAKQILEADAIDSFKDLKPAQQQNKLNLALQAKKFTEAELETLKLGKSNATYHYLGSAKIMAQIGEAFANVIPLNDN